MLETLESLELVLVNTGFKKRDEHLTTYRSGDNSSQIDFLMVRKRTRKNVRDAKVIPGEAVAHQHRLLVMDGTFAKKRKGETTGKKLQKIKVWKLRECAGGYRRHVGERLKRVKRETATEMWKTLKEATVEVAEKLCGKTKNEGEELTELPAVEGPIQQVRLQEVSAVLKMKNKSPGTSEVVV
ncbi:uncharacterized protein LOC134768958 [Penaeus indicus]